MNALAFTLSPPLAVEPAVVVLIAVGLVISSVTSIVALGWIKNSSGKSRKTRQLISTGKKASGLLIRVTDTGMRINGDPRLRMEIEVTPESGSTFTITQTQTVGLIEIPKVGERVTVFYDPTDHTKATVELTPPSIPATAPTEETSAIDKLGRLADMHDQGLITDEEFEARKRALLPEI